MAFPLSTLLMAALLGFQVVVADNPPDGEEVVVADNPPDVGEVVVVDIPAGEQVVMGVDPGEAGHHHPNEEGIKIDIEPEEWAFVEVTPTGQQSDGEEIGYDLKMLETAFTIKWLDEQWASALQFYVESESKLNTLLEGDKVSNSNPTESSQELKGGGTIRPDVERWGLRNDMKYAKHRMFEVQTQLKEVEEEFDGRILSVDQVIDRYGLNVRDVENLETDMKMKFLNAEWTSLHEKSKNLFDAVQALHEETIASPPPSDFIPPSVGASRADVPEWRLQINKLVEQRRFTMNRLDDVDMELGILDLKYRPMQPKDHREMKTHVTVMERPVRRFMDGHRIDMSGGSAPQTTAPQSRPIKLGQTARLLLGSAPGPLYSAAGRIIVQSGVQWTYQGTDQGTGRGKWSYQSYQVFTDSVAHPDAWHNVKLPIDGASENKALYSDGTGVRYYAEGHIRSILMQFYVPAAEEAKTTD